MRLSASVNGTHCIQPPSDPPLPITKDEKKAMLTLSKQVHEKIKKQYGDTICKRVVVMIDGVPIHWHRMEHSRQLTTDCANIGLHTNANIYLASLTKGLKDWCWSWGKREPKPLFLDKCFTAFYHAPMSQHCPCGIDKCIAYIKNFNVLSPQYILQNPRNQCMYTLDFSVSPSEDDESLIKGRCIIRFLESPTLPEMAAPPFTCHPTIFAQVQQYIRAQGWDTHPSLQALLTYTTPANSAISNYTNASMPHIKSDGNYLNIGASKTTTAAADSERFDQDKILTIKVNDHWFYPSNRATTLNKLVQQVQQCQKGPSQLHVIVTSQNQAQFNKLRHFFGNNTTCQRDQYTFTLKLPEPTGNPSRAKNNGNDYLDPTASANGATGDPGDYQPTDPAPNPPFKPMIESSL